MELTNKRLDGESFSKYRERLKESKRAIKAYLRGRVIWHSKKLGTYVRRLHGEIGRKL